MKPITRRHNRPGQLLRESTSLQQASEVLAQAAADAYEDADARTQIWVVDSAGPHPAVSQEPALADPQFISRALEEAIGGKAVEAADLQILPIPEPAQGVWMVVSLSQTLSSAQLRKAKRRLTSILRKGAFVLAGLLKIEISETRIRQITRAAQAALKVSHGHDEQEIVQLMASRAVADLGHEAAVVGLLAGRGRQMRLPCAAGGVRLPADAKVLLNGQCPFSAIAASREAAEATADFLADILPGQNPPFRQGLVVPLISREELLGVLMLLATSARPSLKSVCSLEALRLFATQSALALQNARRHAEVERLAETDALTGVRNRYHFERALRREIARVRRHRHPISLLMVDVCDFKRVNDTYGHLAGDAILRTVARLLEMTVRESDIVARFGGDEFVVLMPDTSESKARLVQARITHAAESHNASAAPRQRFVLSMGLKSALDFSPQALIDEADRAMYQDKDLRVRRRMIEALLSNNMRDVEELDKTLAAVLGMLQQKEPFYFGHAVRVMQSAVRIARQMDLGDEFVESLSLAALLHDVGKVAMQANILNKPGPLTPEEFEVIKTHPALGAELAAANDRLIELRQTIRSHHERWDGRTYGDFPGYPDGLCGEQIPLAARIIRVADSFDSMVSDRPYRKGLAAEIALEAIKQERGQALDPQVVDVFLMQQAAEREDPS